MRASVPGGTTAPPSFLYVQDVLPRTVEADRDEGRVHSRKDAVYPPEVDIPDEALPAAPLVQDLDRSTVLRQRHARFRRRRVDQEFPSHALAKRR